MDDMLTGPILPLLILGFCAYFMSMKNIVLMVVIILLVVFVIGKCKTRRANLRKEKINNRLFVINRVLIFLLIIIPYSPIDICIRKTGNYFVATLPVVYQDRTSAGEHVRSREKRGEKINKDFVIYFSSPLLNKSYYSIVISF